MEQGTTPQQLDYRSSAPPRRVSKLAILSPSCSAQGPDQSQATLHRGSAMLTMTRRSRPSRLAFHGSARLHGATFPDP
jgi:hypothetical protein